jgi:antitoxin component of MazEF toxin-antitoxin module
MARDIVKVRKVGQSLVVTLTQDVLGDVPIEEGDRVLLESSPPRRIILSKESAIASNSRRLELELELLEAQKDELESENEMEVAEYNSGLCQESELFTRDEMKYFVAQQMAKIAPIKVEIAKKKLELFDAQGVDLPPQKKKETKP